MTIKRYWWLPKQWAWNEITGSTGRVRALAKQAAEAKAMSEIDGVDKIGETLPPRVQAEKAAANEAYETFKFQNTPQRKALEIRKMQRRADAGYLFFMAIIGGYSATVVHEAIAAGSPEGSAVWWTGWAIEPVILILVGAIGLYRSKLSSFGSTLGWRVGFAESAMLAFSVGICGYVAYTYWSVSLGAAIAKVIGPALTFLLAIVKGSLDRKLMHIGRDLTNRIGILERERAETDVRERDREREQSSRSRTQALTQWVSKTFAQLTSTQVEREHDVSVSAHAEREQPAAQVECEQSERGVSASAQVERERDERDVSVSAQGEVEQADREREQSPTSNNDDYVSNEYDVTDPGWSAERERELASLLNAGALNEQGVSAQVEHEHDEQNVSVNAQDERERECDERGASVSVSAQVEREHEVSNVVAHSRKRAGAKRSGGVVNEAYERAKELYGISAESDRSDIPAQAKLAEQLGISAGSALKVQHRLHELVA